MGNRSTTLKVIKILIFTSFELTGECIKLLVESKSEIKVIGITTTEKELLTGIQNSDPDLVLFVISEDDERITDLVADVAGGESPTKALVLSDFNGSLDQSKLLKSGASGIVGPHQKEETLIRAIRRVAEGEVWFSQELIARILRNGSIENEITNGHATTPDYQELTSRELDVVRSIVKGLNNRQIAKCLVISEATVRHHLSSIYSKLYVEDRLNLVIYAYQNDLIEEPGELDVSP